MSVNEIFRAALHISSFLSIMKSDFRLGYEMLSLTSMISIGTQVTCTYIT